MAVLIPRISRCVLFTSVFLPKEQNALAFKRDTWCHLVSCLQMIPSHFNEFCKKFKLVNIFLWACTPCGSTDMFPEGSWDTGVGRSSSINPNCRIFIENPWRVKTAEKFDKKASLMNSFKIEKSNQLLLIKCIWGSQEFGRPSSQTSYFLSLIYLLSMYLSPFTPFKNRPWAQCYKTM
jgi:hypothetical protein